MTTLYGKKSDLRAEGQSPFGELLDLGFRVDARALFNLPYPIQSRCQLSYPPLALSDHCVRAFLPAVHAGLFHRKSNRNKAGCLRDPAVLDYSSTLNRLSSAFTCW